MQSFIIHNEKKFLETIQRKVSYVAKRQPVIGSYLWGYEDVGQVACLTIVLDQSIEKVRTIPHHLQRDVLKEFELETVLSSIEEYQTNVNKMFPFMINSCKELQNAELLTDKDQQLFKVQQYYQQQNPEFEFNNQYSFPQPFIKRLKTKLSKNI